MKRGFLIGRFDPPHAGHISLIESARALVDELTILLVSRPDDPIDGEVRLAWLRGLFPACTIQWHAQPVPHLPAAGANSWEQWAPIIAKAHPQRIDYVFAGDGSGLALAKQIGGLFVPLGARILGADQRGIGGLRSEDVRADPWRHWQYLPAPVRNHYALTICLHGIESVGKSSLAERLAQHFGTIFVPEYGRAHCETYGTECREADLLLIGEAQQVMIEAARPWANRLLIADTDALMTAAWSQMMIGYTPDQLICHRKADLYLMLDPDVPFVDDGTRVYKTDQEREKFNRVSRDTLTLSRANRVAIHGDWDARFEAAVAAIEKLVTSAGLTLPGQSYIALTK